jgi:Fe-S-cluster containining protein
MIYEARPKTCRNFPHVAVGTPSLGGRPSSLARWAALCPIIYNALESYKHLTGYHSHPPLSTTSKPPA